MRKKFRVYIFAYEYYVLKCSHCSHVFRFTECSASKPTTAKCQKCEKRFVIDGNCLESDHLGRVWEEAIIIHPDSRAEHTNLEKRRKILKIKQENFGTEKGFVTANKLDVKTNYIG